MIVSTLTLSLGMMMLPASVIAFPIKILLFEGWIGRAESRKALVYKEIFVSASVGIKPSATILLK
jgi:type III secretory pathway component EscR